MTKEDLKLIDNFIRNVEENASIVRVIKQNHMIKTKEEDFYGLLRNKNIRSFYTEYSSGRMITAYEPFLWVVKRIILDEKINVNNMLDEIAAYSLNRSLFINYINGKPMLRKEKSLLTEREYDEQQFINDLINIMLYLSKIKNIFIVLNKVNQICDSTLNVLEKLAEMNNSGLKILIITNETGRIEEYVSAKYKRFIRKCDTLGITSDRQLEGVSDKTEEETDYVLENTMEELESISDMINSFAFEQANYYLEKIYKKVELEKVEVTPEYRVEMLRLYILSSIFLEDYSYALILCEKLHNVDESEEKDEQEFLYYYLKGMANMYIGNEAEAKKDAQICNMYTGKKDNEFDRFLSLMLINMTEFAGWKNIRVYDRNVTVNPELIDLCYKYGYLNHLAHIYVYYFENDCNLYTVVEGIEDRIPNVMKGIELAKELKNDFFLTEAYKKNVMLASYSGCFNVASYFYKKLIEITKRNNNKFEEANVYNGLGYNNCSADKYSEANEYYNKALKIFVDEKSSDYIMETLYNMGINAILAGDYESAAEFLVSVVDIMVLLKKNSLRVCNSSKVLGLIALSYFKLGDYSQTQMFFCKAEDFLKHNLENCSTDKYAFLWDDDLFLYFYVFALLSEKNGNIGEAFENYDKAEFYLKRSVGSKFFNLVFYAEDKARLLRKYAREQEARILLREARDFYNSKGNFLRVKMFDELINHGKWEHLSMKLPVTDVTIEEIMKLVKMERFGIKK